MKVTTFDREISKKEDNAQKRFTLETSDDMLRANVFYKGDNLAFVNVVYTNQRISQRITWTLLPSEFDLMLNFVHRLRVEIDSID